jgi:hypothetical protein
VEQLLSKSTEIPFIEERLPYVEEAVEIIADECPALLTVFNPHLIAFKDYIGGYWYNALHQVNVGSFYDITKG